MERGGPPIFAVRKIDVEPNGDGKNVDVRIETEGRCVFLFVLEPLQAVGAAHRIEDIFHGVVVKGKGQEVTP